MIAVHFVKIAIIWLRIIFAYLTDNVVLSMKNYVEMNKNRHFSTHSILDLANECTNIVSCNYCSELELFFPI